MSRRVRRRRREVAVGLVVVVAGVVLLVTLPGGSRGPGHRAQPRHRSSRPASSPLSAAWEGNGTPVTIAFGGDVHFQGPLASTLATHPSTALGTDTAALFAGSNVTVAQLDTALTDGTCPAPAAKQYVWYAPPSALNALAGAQISVASNANDHAEDCGAAALQSGLAEAASAHFPLIGVGADATQAYTPFRVTIAGQRIAILAATQILPPSSAGTWAATASGPGVAAATDPSQLLAAVRAARRRADTVVVYLYWGSETQSCPSTAQVPLARALVEAGADIVVGSGTHVQAGAGYMGRALVDYGLGNLAFYDSQPPESDSGALLVTITGRHVDRVSWRPATLADGTPHVLTGSAASTAVDQWDKLRACSGLAASPPPAKTSTRAR